MIDDNYLYLSSLNAYLYCPNRFYLEYVQKEWQDNVYTIDSILKHEIVHSEENRQFRGKKQHTQVFVTSGRYGLSGKIDIVESGEEGIYPVEYKRGCSGEWKNDMVQLCAQALCLEEQLEIEIKKGYLWYFGSRKRMEVVFDKELRDLTVKTIAACSEILEGRKRTLPVYKKSKCEKCSIKTICMPRESEILRGILK